MSKDVRAFQLNQYIKPPIVEEMNKEWVLNGKNNSFWDYIIDRYNGSPTNSAIIDSYIDRVYGKGLSIVNSRTNASELFRILSVLSPKETRKIVSDFVLFGSAVGQIRYAKSSKRKIARIEHVERKYIAPNKMNKKGEIPGYWFCSDWSKSHQEGFEPDYYPAFGTSSKNIEVFEIRPYKAGKDYFTDPPYLSGLQYAALEEEIANFANNHIMNGLSAGYIVNFNEGKPPEEVQEKIERKIKAATTGSSNAGKVIISFNDSKENAPSVEAFPSNSSHEEWQLWTNIARDNILLAHRVVSPMLFGVKDNTGLGNNANELREATEIQHETVSRPKQNLILETFQEILRVNEISSPLVFVPLEDKEEKEDKSKEKGFFDENLNDNAKQRIIEVEASKQEFQNKKADELIGLGEDEDDNWECILTQEVDYDFEDERDQILLEMTSTGVARSNARSAQDSDKFKIRYVYEGSKFPQREFCRKMMAANKIYRKEDIIRMGANPVNPGFGPDGSSTYSIWLYKGGPNCHHKWMRKTYVKKGSDVDVKSPLAEQISTAEARRRGDRTRNEPQVSVMPKDMPNNGYKS